MRWEGLPAAHLTVTCQRRVLATYNGHSNCKALAGMCVRVPLSKLSRVVMMQPVAQQRSPLVQAAKPPAFCMLLVEAANEAVDGSGRCRRRLGCG